FLIMFTSGTTGAPKSLLVPLEAIAAFAAYMRDAVDLQPTDNFWNLADPGWAYGLYYAVTGPLAVGRATHFYSGGFSAKSSVEFIREFGITNLAGSPTAFRLLMAANPDVTAPIKDQLRVVSSAGEALNPEVVRWFAEHLDTPIYDHYGQTELGMVVCNHHALSHPVTPGSAGFASPGYRVAVIDDEGNEAAPHAPGILAIDREASPLFWFAGYEQGDEAAGGRYYRSGDTVERNDDGSISFVGRSDDVITSSGYRIGPFDVESALLEHPAIVEAAVIGKPDPDRTEIVKAFVVLAEGQQASPLLTSEIQKHVRARLSAHAYPREIAYVSDLPKTPSGKIQRFLLRAAERA
ncbi:MAG: AMP-binding protein, partial [Tardiphaga sp.]